MEEKKAINGAEAPETEIGRMNRERDIDSALTVTLTDTAKEIVMLAQSWEMGDGMSDENPAMEVAAAILRQNRALLRQKYLNEHPEAGAKPCAPGRFALPIVLRKLIHSIHNDFKGANDEQ